jgi:hypothetical protein
MLKRPRAQLDYAAVTVEPAQEIIARFLRE